MTRPIEQPISPEAEAFLRQALGHFREKQERLREAWQLDGVAQWGLATEEGIAQFAWPDGRVAEGEVVGLGLFRPTEGVWEWGWYGGELPAAGLDEPLRLAGERLGLGYLQVGRVELPDQGLVTLLTAAAVEIAELEGAFFGESEGVMVVLGIEQLTWLDSPTASEAPAESLLPAADPVSPSAVAPGAIPGLTSPATVPPLAAVDHAYLFQPALWEGEGRMDVAVIPTPQPVSCTVRVGHAPGRWQLEVVLGEGQTRWELEPPAPGEQSLRLHGHSPDFGALTGLLTVVDESLLLFYESADGSMKGGETLQRLTADSYQLRGALFIDGDRFTSWSVRLRRV